MKWIQSPDAGGSGFPLATGGNSIVEDGDYKTHYFTGDGNFVVTAKGLFNIFIVSGGGGSSAAKNNSGFFTPVAAGGGGGGAVCEHTMLLSVGTYPVTIGAGGAAGANDTTVALIGSRSGFWKKFGVGGSPTATSGVVPGGGQSLPYALAWDSAGGTSSDWMDENYASIGGTGRGNTTTKGAAGGGAGGAFGASGNSGASNIGGNGGNGISIEGNYYSGGGGGGGNNGTSVGGLGGGGNGAQVPSVGSNGTANTGGGAGGAAGNNNTWRAGGNGGSGIVIVRYKYK